MLRRPVESKTESGLSIGPASPPNFFSIQGTSAENFHFLCYFTTPGVTEIVKKAFAVSAPMFHLLRHPARLTAAPLFGACSPHRPRRSGDVVPERRDGDVVRGQV